MFSSERFNVPSSFAARRDRRTAARRLDQRDNLHRHVSDLPQAHAGLRAVGNLAVTALAAVAVLMAGVALHGEQRQMQQLQQLR